MIRRRAAIQLFGMSFLDVLACALGAVVFLLMQTANRTHEQAEAYNFRIASLDEDVSGLKNELTNAHDSRQTAEDERDKARGEADRKAEKAKKEKAEHERNNAVAAAKEAREDQRVANGKAAKAQAERKGFELRHGKLEGELNKVRGELAAAQHQLGQLRGVVGLKGNLKAVVFVFDTSGSLGQSDLPPESDPAAIALDIKRKLERFKEYKKLLSGWIQALEFETFNVIFFNSKVSVWHAENLVAATEVNRREAVAILEKWKPHGGTNTMQALTDAFRLPKVDTIVIFSDGQPNDAKNQSISSNPRNATERAHAKAAIRRVMEGVAVLNIGPDGKPKVTINTVAMGDYLDRDFGRFLQDLARENGGEFIGR